ncbi:MAG: START-like domain-containing protein [Flavobacteriales bacterium]
MAKKKTVTKKGKPISPKKNSTVKKKGKPASPKKKAVTIKKAVSSKTGRTAAKKSASKAKKVTAKKVVGKKPVAKKSAGKPVSRAKAIVVKKKAAKAAQIKVAKKAAPEKPSISKKKTVKPAKPVVKKTIAKPKAVAKPVTKKATAPIAKPTETKKAPPAKPTTKSSAGVSPKEPKKPLKQRVQIEFNLRSAPAVLYDLISTPSGFAEWYCVDVDVQEDLYIFKWEDGEEEATTLIGRKLGEVIRFHRNDDVDDPDSFFEFRIRIDDMTNDVALIVTDHAWPREVESVRNLWNTQIGSLIRVLGA